MFFKSIIIVVVVVIFMVISIIFNNNNNNKFLILPFKRLGSGGGEWVCRPKHLSAETSGSATRCADLTLAPRAWQSCLTTAPRACNLTMPQQNSN